MYQGAFRQTSSPTSTPGTCATEGIVSPGLMRKVGRFCGARRCRVSRHGPGLAIRQAAILAVAIALLGGPALAATVEVSTTSDTSDGDTSSIANLIADPGADGEISLREAITADNNTGGTDTINFEITDALVEGTHTIQSASALPTMTSLVISDATIEANVRGVDGRQELVFIDAGIEGYHHLAEGLLTGGQGGPEREVVVLDSQRNGTEQITDTLGGYTDVDAIHIISHGSEQGIQLGDTLLSQDSLADYRSELTRWGEALAHDADLLLYGCDLAAGDGGRALLRELGSLTGADIAASDDPTGAGALGGDWDLEYRVGAIEAGIAVNGAAQQQWKGLLADNITLVTADTGALAWAGNQGRTVFYNGENYFLIYKFGSDELVYKASSDNDTDSWSSAQTLVTDVLGSNFNLSLVDDDKFDLVYNTDSGNVKVLTATISGQTITPGTASAAAGGVALMGLSVTRAPSSNRIWVSGRDGLELLVYSADQTTGDADDVSSWTGEVTTEESRVTNYTTLTAYGSTDKVLVVYVRDPGGTGSDGFYSCEITRGSGPGTPLEIGNFDAFDLQSGVLRVSDTEFHVIVDTASAAPQEYTWNGTAWSAGSTIGNANVDRPALLYDRTNDDFYVVALDTNTDDIIRYYKPSGGSWDSGTIADTGEVDTHVYPVTQNMAPPLGSARSTSQIVWAYVTDDGSYYDLYVGNLTVGSPVLTLSDHDAGQETNAFGGSGGETNAELFAFKLDPGGDTISVTQLVFALSDIAALSDGDWDGIEIIVDTNGDGDISGESTAVGGTGVVSTAGGTVTFSTAISVTAATNYILRADFSTLTQCDAVKISLGTSNITTTADKTGSTTSVTHAEAGVVNEPVAHWKLDDAAGGTADDSAGSYDGSITGASWTDGRLCGALDFDGTDYVDMGDVLDFADSEDFTITGWFNRDTFASDDAIVGKRNAVASGLGYVVYVDAAGDTLIFEVGDGTDEFSMTSTTTFTSTGWNHFAAVFDESSAANSKIYINGSDDNETQAGTIGDVGSLANALVFRIGAEADDGSPFDGKIDDIRVYDRALTLAEVQALAATYKVIDLGTVSEERSYGFSINDSEEIAGYDEDSATGDTDSWLCQTCSFTSLGTFAGGSVAESLGINDSGEVVGWSDNAAGDRKAFFYDGSLTDLGTVGGRSDSQAHAVNASSEVVGTVLDYGSPPARRLAFIYLPAPAYTLGAGMTSLGTLGGLQSVATDINDSGQAVGGAQDGNGPNLRNMRPFRWANGVMTDLGTLGGESESTLHRAEAINSSGDVVGLSYTAGGAAHAFLYDGSMNDLGVLTGGDTSWAFDINDDDEIVGTSNVTGGDYHAFIYQDSTMTDLNDLIDTNSTWTLIRATGINDDGEIVGWGENPDGDYHAFLLIQTCSGSGPPGGIAAAEMPLANGSALTDSYGNLSVVVTGTTGEPLAELLISEAEPEVAVEYVVNRPRENTEGLLGPNPGTLDGFVDGVALPRTLTVNTTPSPDTFKLTVIFVGTADEVAELGLEPEELELHVFDETLGLSPGMWIPAGDNIGESDPSDREGESGYYFHDDGTVNYWAVRANSGVFAVGLGAGPSDQDDLDNDSEDDPTPTPRVCGLGMLQVLVVGMFTLFVTRKDSRHRASRARASLQCDASK